MNKKQLWFSALQKKNLELWNMDTFLHVATYNYGTSGTTLRLIFVVLLMKSWNREIEIFQLIKYQN